MICYMQLNTLTKENKILVEKLHNTKIMYNKLDGDSKEFLFSKNDQINSKLDKSLQAGIHWIFLNSYANLSCMSFLKRKRGGNGLHGL